MKLFGRKSGRGDARPALARVGATRLVGGAWPAGYEAQVRAAYERNPVAQRAVRLVADSLAGVALEPCDPAAAALVQARSGGQALLATLTAHLLLHGIRPTGWIVSGWQPGRCGWGTCRPAMACAAATAMRRR